MALAWKRVVIFTAGAVILAVDLWADDVGQALARSNVLQCVLVGLGWYCLCYCSGLCLPVLLARRSVQLDTALGLWVIGICGLGVVIVTLARHSGMAFVLGYGTIAAIIAAGLDTFVRQRACGKRGE